MGKFKKMCQVIERKMLRILGMISVKQYKKLYPRYLRRIGINIAEDYYEDGIGFIDSSAYFDGNDYSLISIGKDTTISMQVIVLTHDYSIVKGLQAIGEPANKRFLKPVTIGANCFIGARAFLLPGTVIGDNCVIGAGSVVRGEIPSNTIVTGNPAKVVGNIEDWARYHLEAGDLVDT